LQADASGAAISTGGGGTENVVESFELVGGKQRGNFVILDTVVAPLGAPAF